MEESLNVIFVSLWKISRQARNDSVILNKETTLNGKVLSFRLQWRNL